MRDPVLVRDATTIEQQGLKPARAPRMPRPRRVLMADPSAFEVAYAINPHMERAPGLLQQVEPAKAAAQWEALRDLYKGLGFQVDVLDAAEGMPDLVFTANQAFVFPDPFADNEDLARGRGLGFVPSRMAHVQRRAEVALVAAFLEGRGYRASPMPRELQGSFEGHGDLLWIGDRRFAVGAVGPRTGLPALRAVADLASIPIVALELNDPDFYHLDTCLCSLDAESALWVPQAFTAASQKTIRALFDNLIPADDLEARRGLAGNAHSPDGRRVIMQSGNPKTSQALAEAGYEVIETETGEFLKSGGSVFCMKLMYW